MAAPKAKSVQQRFGFCDEELKTPAHDALMAWIYEYMPEILAEVYNLSEAPRIWTKRWEYPLKSEHGFILGAADMFVQASTTARDLAVFIEAKPKIRSLGELIRQINFYKASSHSMVSCPRGDYCRSEWLVIAPDDQFAVTLREQGILFLKSPSELISPGRTVSTALPNRHSQPR
ncbi:MAG: hypothetical protein V9H26_03305 [Verrucomicrobiota bacterium]